MIFNTGWIFNNAITIKLLQKVPILPNELCDQKYSPIIFLFQSNSFYSEFGYKNINYGY